MWQLVQLLHQICILIQLNGQYTLKIAQHYHYSFGNGVLPYQLHHPFTLCYVDLCFSSPPEFASYQSLKFESISVEAFTFGTDQYVVFAQPFAGTCSFLEWDHVEMTFRTYDTIESESSNHYLNEEILRKLVCKKYIYIQSVFVSKQSSQVAYIILLSVVMWRWEMEWKPQWFASLLTFVFCFGLSRHFHCGL